MSGSYLQSFLLRNTAEFFIIATAPDQAGSAGLAEGEAETCTGHRVHDRLVEVLHRLNEMALSQDCVGILGTAKLDYFELQGAGRLGIESCSRLWKASPSRLDRIECQALDRRASIP
jgi:hypothetical protein